jgi:hypothetical protein
MGRGDVGSRPSLRGGDPHTGRRDPGAGSLTFSDATSPEPNKAAILQLETAVAGNAGAPGPVLTQFFQLEVVSGGSFHMPFPVPLILEGRADQETVFRFLIVGETPGLAFAEMGCLAVGFTF